MVTLQNAIEWVDSTAQFAVPKNIFVLDQHDFLVLSFGSHHHTSIRVDTVQGGTHLVMFGPPPQYENETTVA